MVRAVDNLSLEIPQGTVFGFLGPNGSGKTTTIRLLLGLIEPTGGSADVLGFDTISQAGEIRAQAGALLEQNGLYDRMTAEDNLEFFGRVNRLSKTERQNRITELLTHLGLVDRRTEMVRNWSRGMKQKLAIARALLHRPQIIFLDEPTAGLDPIAAASLREDLKTLANKEGMTVFLNTHNLPEAEKLCDRIGVIREGKLLAVDHPDRLRAKLGSAKLDIFGQGFTEELLMVINRHPAVLSIKKQNGRLSIHLKKGVEVAPLINLIVNAGGEIEEIRKGKTSLEEAFLALMEEVK
jgi:ABC-2 type transport system ATP-binding protein